MALPAVRTVSAVRRVMLFVNFMNFIADLP
jgi:hypothetical protein